MRQHRLRGEQAGFPVADDVGNAERVSCNDAETGRLGFQQDQAERLANGRPDQEIVAGIMFRKNVRLECAEKADPLRREQGKHMIAHRPVADDGQVPGQVAQLGKRGGQNLVGPGLVALAHHADGEQFHRRGCQRLCGRRRAQIRFGIQERQQDREIAVRHHGREAVQIRIVDRGDGVGTFQGGIGRCKAEGPVAGLAFWRPAGLDNGIGQVEAVCEGRADPVRRLVIKMIGQEQVRPVTGLLPVCGDPLRFLERRCPDFRLNGLAALLAPGPEAAGNRHLVTEAIQRLDDQPAHGPVSGGNRMVQGLHRRCEGDFHGHS